MPRIYGSSRLSSLATGSFFSHVTHFLVALVITNFLVLFISDIAIGWVLAGSSVAIAVCLASFPRIFVRFGTRRVLIALAIGECLSALGLGFAGNAWEATIFYCLQGIFAYTIFLGLDLLLEAESADETTGRLRGTFLVIANTAVLLAPFMIGGILHDDNFRDVFFIAAAFMVPFVILGTTFLPNISHGTATHVSLRTGLKELPRRLSLVPIMLTHLLVLCFFAWEVYYIPLYLHEHIGLSWKIVSTLFAISVVPYVLFEYPMGRIADKYLGEKEMTIAGFLIVSVATAALSFISGTNIIAWAAFIFLGNIGGAAIEVMTETHFFKRVSITDTNLIGIFRMLRPLSTIAGPLAASAALVFVPFSALFIVFGAILCVGVPISFLIVDTR